MCMPPADSGKDPAANKKRLDSLRNLRCPRLMSSAAEYYRNRDWKQTVKIYKEITTLDCDEWNPVYAPPQEIYQYYAIAYEQMGKFDSAEYVLLDGLQKLPENIELRKRLAYSYKKQGKFSNEIIEYERLVDMDPKNIGITFPIICICCCWGLFVVPCFFVSWFCCIKAVPTTNNIKTIYGNLSTHAFIAEAGTCRSILKNKTLKGSPSAE